jgi:hypothetical protein
MPQRSPYTIAMDRDEKGHLEAITRRYTSRYCDIIRAKVALLAADGLSNKEIA